jgi:hypothetical protein
MTPVQTVQLLATTVQREEQLPSDVGKAGPIGLVLTVLLVIAIVLLVKSMTRHLRRLPRSFDGDDGPRFVVPDTPAELVDGQPDEPGQDLLDTLRRAPLAIEPPRRPEDTDPRH